MPPQNSSVVPVSLFSRDFKFLLGQLGSQEGTLTAEAILAAADIQGALG